MCNPNWEIGISSSGKCIIVDIASINPTELGRNQSVEFFSAEGFETGELGELLLRKQIY